MRFHERKQFDVEPEVFSAVDAQQAMKFHEEWLTRHSTRPRPRFFEIDVRHQKIDPLWHIPTSDRTPFSRQLDIPAIVGFGRATSHDLTKIGRTPQRTTQFLLSHNVLKAIDYFPLEGDLVYWNGYRTIITKVFLDPEGYWQQTNLWLGLYVETVIAPRGDSKPLVNPGEAVVEERGEHFTATGL